MISICNGSKALAVLLYCFSCLLLPADVSLNDYFLFLDITAESDYYQDTVIQTEEFALCVVLRHHLAGSGIADYSTHRAALVVVPRRYTSVTSLLFYEQFTTSYWPRLAI
jgi:hypothetical protein